MKALLLFMCALCAVLSPVAIINSGNVYVSALMFAMMVWCVWKFFDVLKYGVHEKTAVARNIVVCNDERYVETNIPGFGPVEIPEGMAMKEGDILKLLVRVNCQGPKPQLVPVKFGNIRDKD